MSIRYTERLVEADVEPSVGSVSDSFDNALAETVRPVQGRDDPSARAVAIFDGMSPADQDEVRKEAKAKGVDVLDIVRSSLEVLIAESGQRSRDA